ncbi:MAG: EamA family transporter [Bacteroidetes bacterium]|nr:EamA family transporter [Bacteroidota bacterium]
MAYFRAMFALDTPKRKAYLYMHLSILLWGLTGVFGRGIHLDAELLVWYRMLITAISMFTFILFTKTSLRVSRTSFFKLAGIGTVLAIHWVFFYSAIKASNISIALSMLASQGLFTALAEPLVSKKKFKWDELIFSVTAMIGIWLIFSVEKSYTRGIIYGLLASFIGAFFNILNKKVVDEHGPALVSFYEILVGFVVLSLYMPIFIHYSQPVKLLPNALDWVQLIVLAVLCTHVTLVLSLAALRHLSVFTLNLSINLEPVYTIALAFLIFHENKHLHTGFFIGAAIIMSSVVLETYFQSRSKP